jgi:murein DD-endopeptidase MepM/ murein hydrolase activator NlpD
LKSTTLRASALTLAMAAALGAAPAVQADLHVTPRPDGAASGLTANSPSVPAARPEKNAFPVRGPFNWGQQAAAFGGPRGGRSHEGQDVMSRTGTPIVAVADGTVLETGNDGGRGNYLNLYDPARKVTYVYMHMVAPAAAQPGQDVAAGRRLGGVGCTGSCFGDHLHFEVRSGRGGQGAARDPRPLLEKWRSADRIPATLPPGQS